MGWIPRTLSGCTQKKSDCSPAASRPFLAIFRGMGGGGGSWRDEEDDPSAALGGEWLGVGIGDGGGNLLAGGSRIRVDEMKDTLEGWKREPGMADLLKLLSPEHIVKFLVSTPGYVQGTVRHDPPTSIQRRQYTETNGRQTTRQANPLFPPPTIPLLTRTSDPNHQGTRRRMRRLLWPSRSRPAVALRVRHRTPVKS